jgi:hypothetical protein
MLESECSTDFSALADCQAACATIPDSGNFDIEASYDKHDVQCRLIHLGAVAGDPTVHCNHARYVAVDFCDAGGGGELTCERTCDVIMGNCTGENAVYESRDECLTACAVFPLGSQADLVENTVGCRLYHGTSGGLDPGTHCDHAGPTGDGHCGEENEPEETGPCNSYCMLMEAGCPAEFTADFGDFPACQSACATELEDRGAKPDALYTVDTARDEDGLQCRAYYLVKALAGDATACARVSLSATCE